MHAYQKILQTLAALSLAGCSMIGVRTAEQPAYQVLKKDQSVELRLYQPHTIISTHLPIATDAHANTNFQTLGGYIFGDNMQNIHIPMTIPVVQETKNAQQYMYFVLPKTYQAQNAPTPNSDKVLIEDRAAEHVASLKVNSTDTAYLAEQETMLRDWVSRQGNLSSKGTVRLAQYDPPWSIPWLRRTELMLPVDVR